MKSAWFIMVILFTVAIIGVCLMVKFATEISMEEKRQELAPPRRATPTKVQAYARPIGVIPVREVTNLDRFPYTAAIIGNGSNSWSLACFGAVILTKWVVVSAHCHKPDVVYHALIYKDFVNNANQSVAIVSWKVHDKYNASDYKFDIAVAKLDSEIEVDDEIAELTVKHVRAVDVCLWKTVLSMNHEVYLTNEMSSYFRTTDDSSVCSPNLVVDVGDASVICLDFSQHPDCFMNEFGPIFWDDKVVGVLAAKPNDCSTKTALFTNVSYYFDWILQVTRTTVV